jgi:hypothetical protein
MIMDLYTLLVENVFGGFWLSVVGLGVIILIILAMGGLSGYSMLTFLTFFLICMAFGYGYVILMILILGIAMYYAVSQYMGWLERSGGN